MNISMAPRQRVLRILATKRWSRAGFAVAAAGTSLVVSSGIAAAAQTWAVVNSAQVSQVRTDAAAFGATYSYNPSGRPSISCRASLDLKITGPGYSRTRDAGNLQSGQHSVSLAFDGLQPATSYRAETIIVVGGISNPEAPPCRDHAKYPSFGQDFRTQPDPAQNLHLSEQAIGVGGIDAGFTASATPSRHGHTSVSLEFGPTTSYGASESMHAMCGSGSCRYNAVLVPKSRKGGRAVLDWNTTYYARAVLSNSLSGVQTSEPVSWKTPDKCSLSVFHNSDFSGCNLGKVNWSNSTSGVGPNLKLSNFNLNDATLNQSLIQHQKMFRTLMVGAKLNGVSFFDTDLDGANMSGAELRDAHFNGASMTDVELAGADLTGATQLPPSIAQAKCTSTTVWPDGTKGHGNTCPPRS